MASDAITIPHLPYDAQAVMTMLQHPERYTPSQRAYAAERARAIWQDVEPGVLDAWQEIQQDMRRVAAYWHDTFGPLLLSVHRQLVDAGVIAPTPTHRQALRAARQRAHQYTQRRNRRA